MDGYQRISRYKSQLMGMAVMVVVYGHLLYYHSWLKNYEDLNFTIWYTLGSVEMFMFVSGFGIYHSLKKNRDSFTFYRRRLSRLLPSFLPVMIAWCAAGMLMRDMTVGQALGNLTGLGWWFQQKQQFNWYIPAILVLYLLSPLFFDCIERLGKKSVLVFPALFIVIMAGWGSNLLMAVTRFPTYFLGMYFGARFYRGKKPTRRQVWVWTVVATDCHGYCALFLPDRQKVSLELWDVLDSVLLLHPGHGVRPDEAYGMAGEKRLGPEGQRRVELPGYPFL